MSKILRIFFSHALVAGPRQKEYAKAIGFQNEVHISGFLSADHKIFNLSENSATKKKQKEILFVGRMNAVKGIDNLIQAWLQLISKNGWTLRIIGGRKYEWNRFISKFDISNCDFESIKYEEFRDPLEIAESMVRSSVFILPSEFEPWGVVLHEAALSKCFLIATNNVGAVDQLIIRGKNGLICSSTVNELVKALKFVINLDHGELVNMGKLSKSLGIKIHPSDTAQALYKLVEK